MPFFRPTPIASPWRRRFFAGAAALAVVGWAWQRGAGDAAGHKIPGARKPAAASARGAPPRSRVNRLDDESALVTRLRATIARDDPVANATESLRALLALDAERALRVATLVARNADERYAFLSALLTAWAERDAGGAWRWALAHDREERQSGQSTLTELVLLRFAATAPRMVAAVLFAAGAPDSSIVDQGIAALLQAQRRDESCALLATWASAGAGDPDARVPFERVAFSLAKDSPAHAAEWLLALPASPGRDAGLAVAASEWASRDPTAAIAWAQALPGGETRQLAVERAFGTWVARDGESALGWLVANEAAPDADRLIARWLAVSEQVRAHPGAAQAWLALIRDPALRARSAESLPNP